MSDFYTNVAIHRNKICVCGYLDGRRYKQELRYKPYLFLPSKDQDSEYRTLKGEPVEKLEFDSINDARDFTKQYTDVKGFNFYGITQFVYLYIRDQFPGEIKFDSSLIQTHNIDIETGRTADGAFADVELANGPVTLIGIGIKDKRIVLGYGDYTPKEKRVSYIKCKDEIDMLRNFVAFWASEDFRPDVVTGWNIEQYDIPYLINRITNLLGAAEAKRLSPWGVLREKTIAIKGRETKIYEPLGVTILDYLSVYRKFVTNQQESYTLDHIAFVETGKGKLDYSEVSSLDELYQTNFEKYVDYNITDIDRVADIDKKNRYLELVFTMAYDAKVNFLDALTSVRLWDVIIHNYLLDKKVVIPQDQRTPFTMIPGGYCKETQNGFHDWVVSFDLTSLYPHLIIQYNISPETFVGIDPWEEKDLDKVIAGEFDNTEIKAKGLSQAANGARFTNKFQGFLPELMKIQFQQRKAFQKKMKEARAKGDEVEAQRYHNFQLAKKIQLNSAYGALGNKYHRWYDWRLASAITLSGQLSVRWIEKKINDFLNSEFGTKVDYIVAIDTDSCYIDLSRFVLNYRTSLAHVNLDGAGGHDGSREDVLNVVDRFCEKKIAKVIEAGYKELAEVLNVYENAMSMKREAIADKALWKVAKCYIMNVLDQEGQRYDEPKLKIMGIEVVKAVIPQACRTALKEAIRIIMNSDEAELHKFVEEFKKKFYALGFDDIAMPRGVNGLSKYSDPATLWKKATPMHVKAALVYNHLLKEKGLDSKYPMIYEKDKLKFIHLKMPNPAKCKVIAAPRFLPSEFDLDRHINYDLMFEKSFMDPLQGILNVIKWSPEEISSLESFFA